MQLIEQKKGKCHAAIRRYVGTPSIYNLNTPGADCYDFTLLPPGSKNLDGTVNKKWDWTGGMNWLSSLEGYSKNIMPEYIYKFSDDKFYKITN